MKKNIKTGAIYILALLIIIISGCNNSTGDNKHEISQVIKGDINENQLKEFLEAIEKRCPVSDTLKNGTNIIGSIAKA